jgi:chitinase
MTDVANKGVEDFVDEEGKEYFVDGLDKDDDTEKELDDEEDNEEVKLNEAKLIKDELATELQPLFIVSNPGFNYLIPVKDFGSFIRNNFSCKRCSKKPILEEDLVSV